MARSKYKVQTESLASRRNTETLLRKRREQGCVPGICTVTCEVDHRSDQVAAWPEFADA